MYANRVFAFLTITLKPEQETWLLAHVAAGEYASVEDAARQIIGDRIAEIDEAERYDELEWAKPLVDEARATLTRGETLNLEEHRARNAERLAALRK